MMQNLPPAAIRKHLARIALLCACSVVLAGCGETRDAGALQQDAAEVTQAPIPDHTPMEREEEDEAPADPSDCNLANAEAFVGEQADAQGRADLLEAVSPVIDIRWVGPGDATTEDFHADRLNVMLDAGDTIIGVSCG